MKEDLERECEVVVALNVKTVVFWDLTRGMVEKKQHITLNIGKTLFTTRHHIPKTALFITQETDTVISIVSQLVRHRDLEAGCAYLIFWNHVNKSAGSFRWSYSLPPDHTSDRPKAGVWSYWMFTIYWVMQYIPTFRKDLAPSSSRAGPKRHLKSGGPNILYVITQVQPLCKTC